MTSPLLWYLNRGTGIVLVVVFTLTVVLGVLATGRSVSRWWPRFVTQGLHRGLAAVSVLLLLAHAVVAVVDEFVDIRWWQAVVPFGATYEPLWLGLGTLALDLTVVVVATSLARSRLPHRLWFVLHLTTYAAWVAGVVHGLGIGTDAALGWSVAITAACVAAVVVAVLGRVVAVLLARRRSRGERRVAPSPVRTLTVDGGRR
ncbi:ferric reductase-like transmembrane domain-containing protein [Phycicoccus sp. MAQZ13P-2]|uniref:ferric reductase-like transmembrane domain-containing protein n=1 Tax=Phycicoccus mangrovi TaxID=2840470 RepID=UPI001C0016EB|nr:ferric reductase-like transmembrane domain-containing protein [Phycicoccus mangrovi]MBT9257892.1 ferric reductase-like transmembrane domain-containing protein [Phycicoccus mangrovi]MBT9272895.1 ferric reductase-like transmembrane domain-containing protein [Phycicoccus mangrovi]